jgi:predicted metal-dependent enzyme (double-stranded beta helix superfamily)
VDLPAAEHRFDCRPARHGGPGTFQNTRIPDHVAWCVLGVIQGVEHEDRFDADLNLLTNANEVGHTVSRRLVNIHRVRNIADTTAISIHVYGTDLSRVGSSAGRYYD